MLHRVSASASFALALLICVDASAAPPQRTFVASNGNDANPCSLTSPCRTFNIAIGKVATDGEVVALDSAGYGAMTITKAVTVLAPPGVHAGITASGMDGVHVSVPANTRVTLRGLVIATLTSGFTGVANPTGAELSIESCAIDGFDTNVFHTGPGKLRIADSRLTRGALITYGAGDRAFFTVERTYISYRPGSPSTVLVRAGSRGAIKDSTIEGDDVGISIGILTATDAAGPVELLIENSIIKGHLLGIQSDAGGGSYSSVGVSRSQLVNNGEAFVTTAGGSIALSESRVTHNNLGGHVGGSGGLIFTDGHNWFAYNGLDLGVGTTLTGLALR